MITPADVSLDGKVAIVTGGARGIGRAIALGLAAFGAKVNVGSRALLSAHVLLPLTDGGLRSRVTTTLGFDYTF